MTSDSAEPGEPSIRAHLTGIRSSLLSVLSGAVVPWTLGVLRRLTPARNHIVVSSFPPIEGNGVAIVESIVRRYAGKIYWLGGPDDAYLKKRLGRLANNITTLAKRDPRGVWAYITAQAVFFTHGLYGQPPACERKPTVNLWHGMGMKGGGPLFPNRRLHSPSSDLLVATTEVWRSHYARLARIDPSGVVVTGFPRNDLLRRPCVDIVLASLGVDPARPFVVWLPTFRAAKVGDDRQGWRDSGSEHGDVSTTSRFAPIVLALGAAGIQTVIKPHPLDSQSRSVDGAILITDDQLATAGSTLYELLARSRALVTDFSSVVFDYLLLDRPIGFYLPDVSEYEAARGLFPPDVLGWLPGHRVAPDNPSLFLDVLREDARCGQPRRQRAMTRADLVVSDSYSDDLLDALVDRFPSAPVAKGLSPRGDCLLIQDEVVPA